MQKRKSFLSSLSVNTILILITVLFFFIASIMGFFPGPGKTCDDTVCKYISIQPSNILAGNYIWTFLTSIFMHGGFFHIFANMLSLMFIGSLVERILGHKRYLAFYLISGIFAALFFVALSLFFPADMNSYAVGASGAIFGLIGLLMLLTPNLPVYLMFIPLPIKMKYAAPGMLIVLWFISLAGNVPIGNTAHLGGLIAGLVYGFYLKTKYKKKTQYIREYFK